MATSSPEMDPTSPRKSLFDDMSKEELINKCKGLLTIAQKAKQAKSEYQNEIESFKIQLDKCDSEKNAAQETIRTLQDIVNSLTEQKLSYITEMDSMQTKLKALNSKIASQEEDINKFKAELKDKEKAINDAVQKISEFDNEVVSLKRQNNRLLEENEQLINQLTELEGRTAELNEIGLQQREQLKTLEAQLQSGSSNYESNVELNKKISLLEEQLNILKGGEHEKKIAELQSKISDVTQMYESEKSKKEKANSKLKSYKEKIIKCSSCIAQLKNSRFILTKTINDYSENIPKWQNDILKASKVLDEQITVLNRDNCTLKEKLNMLETQNCETRRRNNVITEENSKLKEEYDSLHNKLITIKKELTEANNKNELLNKEIENMNMSSSDNTNSVLDNEKEWLKKEICNLSLKYNECILDNNKLNEAIINLKNQCDSLNEKILNSSQNATSLENLNLQIKTLESEKAILVKEKLHARDMVIELEYKNKMLHEQTKNITSEVTSLKSQLDKVSQEKAVFESNYKEEKETEINTLHCRIMSLQEKYDLLKKEHGDLVDLNGLLKEEVDTLKLSLEQPKDNSDNMSDLNVSLQADLVKLETKLSAYKQENSSLLNEVKESRAKIKECDTLLADYEETKTKLLSYKTENAELLNEMKEINQVIKERGETISKLQMAITEMERLIETLEKDRNSFSEETEYLLKKIETLENELKNAKQKSHDKNSERIEKVAVESESDKKLLMEKDLIISSLQEELEKLKQQQPIATDLPNEDMSTSTISKAEEHARMKDLDETFEEKYSKLRIFALKLKKKLNETITQLQNVEQDKVKLEKLLSENKVVAICKDEMDSHGGSQNNGSQISELESKIKNLTLELEASRDGDSEAEKLKAELNTIRKQLAAEAEAHKATKENLDKARREAKKKNVLSLEMEDYERSMKDLTNKMEEYKKKIVQMESTIDTQEGTITAMKTQIKLLEEQIKTEETQTRLTKEELHHAREDSKEKENVIQTRSAIIAQLERELEDEKRTNEGAKLEIMASLSEKEKIIMSLGEDKVELSSKLKRLEFKCSELEEKLRVTNIELEDMKSEYTSYKVRALSVLRQNQTVDHSQEEQLKEEAAALKSQVETLSAKLKTSQEQCAELSAEAETNKRRAAEATSEATRAQQRTTRMHADVTRLTQQLESERSQHKLQVSTLTQCYKTQISDLETRLQQQTEDLRNQLALTQEKLKSGASASLADVVNRNQYMVPVIPKDDSDGELDINVSMIPREEGEGSESAPSPPLSKSFINASGRRSPMPLERLLEEGVPEDEGLDTSSLGLTPEQEISDLKRKLQSQQQRVKHVTVLLSESERECARMAQLSELLKAELRRLRGTTSGAHNTEYMKNVTLKFLTLPPGDERSRLVPVLQKILTLSHEDTQKLHAVAKGIGVGTSKGWGSYLPWPGGK